MERHTTTDPWTYREADVLGADVARGMDLVGFSVEATDGSIGKIDEATYDASRSYIVVDTGPWIFGKKVMLPAGVIQRVDLDSETVFADRTKDEIKNAPEFDESRYSDDAYREELGGYYYGGTSARRGCSDDVNARLSCRSTTPSARELRPGRLCSGGEHALPERRRAAPEGGDRTPVGAGHVDVVDAVAAVARALRGDRHQLVALLGRREELDRAAGGDGDDAVRVAGERERRVGEREHDPPVAGAVAVEHLRPDAHPHAREARSHLVDRHPQLLGGPVAPVHGIADRSRQAFLGLPHRLRRAARARRAGGGRRARSTLRASASRGRAALSPDSRR